MCFWYFIHGAWKKIFASVFWVSFEYVGDKKTFVNRVIVKDGKKLARKLWVHIKMDNKNKKRDEEEDASLWSPQV